MLRRHLLERRPELVVHGGEHDVVRVILSQTVGHEHVLLLRQLAQRHVAAAEHPLDPLVAEDRDGGHERGDDIAPGRRPVVLQELGRGLVGGMVLAERAHVALERARRVLALPCQADAQGVRDAHQVAGVAFRALHRHGQDRGGEQGARGVREVRVLLVAFDEICGELAGGSLGCRHVAAVDALVDGVHQVQPHAALGLLQVQQEGSHAVGLERLGGELVLSELPRGVDHRRARPHVPVEAGIA